MLSINTNLSSLIAQNSLTTSTNKLNQAIERMTTGFKINHAKDNAANYSIATNLTTKIGAYMVAEDNCAMGLDMLATANGSLDQISDKLSRLRILAEQASNGTYGEQSLKAINVEANALVDEIERLYSTSEYNGKSLLQVTPAESPLQTYSEAEIAAMTPISESSDLSENTQFTISTAEDLAKLATLTNSGVLTSGKTFVLLNDIDLKSYSSGEGWVPIGNETNTFNAIFDGNGYVIRNLKINRTGETYQGLFGSIDNAEIKNVGLENLSVKGYYYVAGLVGKISNSTILNCYAVGNVFAIDDYVGGLVGYSTTNSIIDKCYADVDVTGNMRVGGLLGFNLLNSRVLNSYSEGNVEGSANSVGGLVGYNREGGIIDKCYATGSVLGHNGVAGGLVGECHLDTVVTNSYATGCVKGNGNYVGGLVGSNSANSMIDTCYATGDVEGLDYVGGLIGYTNHIDCTVSNSAKVSNISVGDSSDAGIVMTLSDIKTIYNNETMGFTEANGWYNLNGQLLHSWDEAVLMAKGTIPITTLQVGINADSNSQISMNTGVKIDKVGVFRGIGNDTSTDFLTQLDTMLATINSRQTELGAIENRLESALDEISTQYENLVSTRSTIRDADIAEVSSEYIRQQILQQASATLMSTANQSPSIALQLI